MCDKLTYKVEKVLFFSLSKYDLCKDDSVLKKKLECLSKFCEPFIFGRGKTGIIKKYSATFLLLNDYKKIGKMPLWLISAFFILLRFIKKEKINSIIVQSPGIESTICVLLKKIANVQLIVEVHGDWVNSIFFYHKIPFEIVCKKCLELIGLISLSFADKVRVISNATEMQVRQFVKRKKIYKFPAFIDVDLYTKESFVMFKPIILFAGWLYKIKGVHFLVEAFAQIQNQFPDYCLTIVGEGPCRFEIEKKLKELNVRKFLLTGWLPQNELRKIMRECTCLVLPSLSEGLGRVLIEASLLKKPLIGSNVGGIPEVINDGVNGFLFQCSNVNDLKNKLKALLMDIQFAIKMGETGFRINSLKFSPEKYFGSYKEMIYSKE